METTKKFLNLAIGISVVVCSLSLLIFAIKNNTAKAQNVDNGSYQAVGCLNDGIGKYAIIGYNQRTGGSKVIATGHY